MRFWPIFVVGFIVLTAWIFYSAASQQDGEWKPGSKLVAHVDGLALTGKLPAEFGPLSAYSRFYWGEKRDGRKFIKGVLVDPHWSQKMRGWAPGSVRVGPRKQAPAVGDGGCTVVNVEFDVKADKLLAEDCNPDLFHR